MIIRRSLSLILMVVILSLSGIAHAVPCNRVSHETLRGAIACAEATKKVIGLDLHHTQMMNAMMNSDIVPPQMTPPQVFMPYPFFMYGSLGFSTQAYGFRKPYLIYPNSLSLYYYPY